MPLEGWTWGFPSHQTKPKRTSSVRTNTSALPHEQVLSASELDRKRRIDRILVPHSFHQHIQECYTTFLASSDHKAIVINIRPIRDGPTRRKQCLVNFLKCQETIDNTSEVLKNISTTGFTTWEDSMPAIHKAAFAYERQNTTTGTTEVQALLRESSVHQLTPGAADYLASRGYEALPTTALYRCLAALSEQS